MLSVGLCVCICDKEWEGSSGGLVVEMEDDCVYMCSKVRSNYQLKY